jgi:hypothetical protein
MNFNFQEFKINQVVFSIKCIVKKIICFNINYKYKKDFMDL